MYIKLKISKKGHHGWNDYYSKIPGYTFLDEDGKDYVWLGFCGEILPEGCLEITNYDELLKIQKHRELTHFYPQPMEKV